MKTFPTIAGLILASAISVPASATSKGEALTLCKLEVQESISDVTRVRTSKIKERASGTYVKLRVSTEGQGAQKVECAVEDGVAVLMNDEGNLIASKNAVDTSGSE